MGTLRYRPEIGWLLQIAMLIFVATVLIGIANGTKVFGTLDRNVLLTHVHAGTLGWITLGVAAACLWIFGGTAPRAANEGFARGLVIALAGSIPLYVIGFWSGSFVARVALGQPQAAGGAVLLEVPALVIFLIRVGWSAMRSSWTRAGSGRHAAVAVPFLILNVGSIIYLVLALFVLNIYKDFSEVPTSVAVTLDHALFVGVMTNLNFALLIGFTADRPAMLPWADNLIFWGMNAGVAAFIVVLLANITFFERLTAPVMGIAILLGLVTFTLRLWTSPSTRRAQTTV